MIIYFTIEKIELCEFKTPRKPGKYKMIITIWGRTFRVALRRSKKRNFGKERRERQIWRHQYPDPLADFP